MSGVLLITVLVITGGVIAFIGDRLGTKIGKKRLSIFGLRPRHTSIIITIFTGIVITTLTFGVMAAVSDNVRTALFGMEQLNRSMKETKDSLTAARADLATAKTEQEATDAALRQSKDEVSKLSAQQKELEAESAKLQAGNEALQAANAELKGQNASLSDSNKELATANTTLTQDNQNLEKRAEQLRAGLITVREGDIVFRAGEVVASGVIQGNRSAAEVAADLDSLAAVANRNVSAKVGRDRSDQEIWVYQPERDAAVETIAKSKQDIIVRMTAASNIVRGEEVRTIYELYPNSIIYRDKEFIIARPYDIRSGSDSEAEETVMNFLKDVNFAATNRGILPDPLQGTVGVMEGAQFYEIVAQLRGQRGPVILSAYANGNTDALGPLRLNINVERKAP